MARVKDSIASNVGRVLSSAARMNLLTILDKIRKILYMLTGRGLRILPASTAIIHVVSIIHAIATAAVH